MSGRVPGTGLNANGRAQARRLAERLAARHVSALYSSPLLRAQETAGILSQALSLPIETLPDVREVDFGDWTGQPIDGLAADRAFQAFNQHRIVAPVPGGELMLEVQARAVGALIRLSARHAGQTVVIVSHADVIRATLAACLGSPLDLMLRFTVDPASISEIALNQGAPVVACVNDTAHLVGSPG